LSDGFWNSLNENLSNGSDFTWSPGMTSDSGSDTVDEFSCGDFQDPSKEGTVDSITPAKWLQYGSYI
jgi:hypothetical protein